MEETKTAATEKPETEEQEQQQETERKEQETEQAEKPETVKSSEAESFETVKGSEISESPETENNGISESSETATTEYETPEGETETVTETETETETERETKAAGGNDGQEGSTDARSDAMNEFYDALVPEVTQQEYYAEMLGYMDSINHTCTITLNLCLAILLCAGIVAGSMMAHTFWSRIR